MRGKGVVLLKVLVVVALAGIAAGCTTELRRLQGANQQLISQQEALNKRIAELEAQIAQANQDEGDIDQRLLKMQADVDFWKGQAEAYEQAIEKYKAMGATGFGEDLMRELAKEMDGIYLEGGGIRLASDVLFDSGKTDLKPDAVAVLKKAAEAFQRKGAEDLHLRIDGHTDSQPIKYSKWKDNMELSQARSRAVWLELRKEGVSPERMFTAGFGEFVPIDDNAAAAGRASNRRVEIWLVPAPAVVQVSE